MAVPGTHVARHYDDFRAVILDQSEYDALVADRPVFIGKTLHETMVAPRSAVEMGKELNRPVPGRS